MMVVEVRFRPTTTIDEGANDGGGNVISANRHHPRGHKRWWLNCDFGEPPPSRKRIACKMVERRRNCHWQRVYKSGAAFGGVFKLPAAGRLRLSMMVVKSRFWQATTNAEAATGGGTPFSSTTTIAMRV